MSVKRGGLGRNLSALLSQSGHSLSPGLVTTKPVTGYVTRAVDSLQPGKFQPRGEMDENSLLELADSIKQQGLLQPLIIREIAGGHYEIIAGERRWRACQMAGLSEIPVVIRQVDDETAMAIALIENLQRDDLNVLEEARAMQRLVSEFGLTHEQVAQVLCKSRTVVSNYLRLLNLNPDVRRMLEYGDLDMGHARCLLILDDSLQSEVAKLIVAKGLSVRETESLVARVKAGKSLKDSKIEHAPLFKAELDALAVDLKTRIKLKPGRAGKGTLLVHYHDAQFLEELIGRLGTCVE